MNKLILPVSLIVLMIIMAVAFNSKKSKCRCSRDSNGDLNCSHCKQFNFGSIDELFKKKEKFANISSEVPGVYTIRPVFPKITDNKPSAGTPYWL